MEGKFKKLVEEIESYDKNIMKFNRNDENLDFIPATCEPSEEGCYVTIRCGLSGIYQMLNEWKKGEWAIGVTDGSTTIAYRRNKVILKNVENGN